MKFILPASILSIAVAGGWALLFAITGNIPTAAATIPATVSDFSTAVQAGMQAASSNPTAAAQRQIQSQDYKSAWDEFGTGIMIDGAAPPATASSQILGDIVQSAETAQNYNRQEADYLRAAQTTPEEIQAAEESSGADILPDEQIDPNPSMDANPGVSVSPSDIPPDTAASSSDTDASSTGTATVSSSGTDTAATSTDMSVDTTTMNGANDTMIFDAILQGEQSQAQTTSSTSTDMTAPDNTQPSP